MRRLSGPSAGLLLLCCLTIQTGGSRRRQEERRRREEERRHLLLNTQTSNFSANEYRAWKSHAGTGGGAGSPARGWIAA